MRVSSRTPEGDSGFCAVCGKAFVLETSAAGDVPCPNCGSLVWSESPLAEPAGETRPDFYDGVDVAPAFLHIRPSPEALPLVVEMPEPEVHAGEYWLGRLLQPLAGLWSRRRRLGDREQLFRLLLQASWCATRDDLEKLIGPPRALRVEDDVHRVEHYTPAAGHVLLTYREVHLIAISGLIPFSSMEWGAGLEQDHDWEHLLPVIAS